MLSADGGSLWRGALRAALNKVGSKGSESRLGDEPGVVRVKHTKVITRGPQVAQLSNFQAFKDFLVELTDQAVEFVFQKTD